jgi:hypothetical protein
VSDAPSVAGKTVVQLTKEQKEDMRKQSTGLKFVQQAMEDYKHVACPFPIEVCVDDPTGCIIQRSEHSSPLQKARSDNKVTGKSERIESLVMVGERSGGTLAAVKEIADMELSIVVDYLGPVGEWKSDLDQGQSTREAIGLVTYTYVYQQSHQWLQRTPRSQ